MPVAPSSPPNPVSEMLPVPVVWIVALSVVSPAKSPVAAPVLFALSVMPPLTVEMLEPELSTMSRTAVRLTLPDPLVAISEPAVGRLIVSASTVSDLFEASVSGPFRLTVSPASPPLMSIVAA